MSDFTVTYDGDVAGDWWTLDMVATGATIVFANADDVGEPSLTITGLTIGNIVVVDGHARSVLVNGVESPNKIQPGSGWPFLHPGDNDLTVTGATGDFDHTNLYVG